jgi:ParB-like chromosome segregation protein Spo0J
MAVSELRMWPENPRRIRPGRLDDLMASMTAERAMLQAKPLWALPDGTVFAGNQRLRGAIELGWVSIPVVIVEGLTPAQVRSWALLDHSRSRLAAPRRRGRPRARSGRGGSSER